MGNYIESIDLNIQNGLLTGKMDFLPSLNILSGENGTFKTKSLQFIKSGAKKLFDPQVPCRIQAVSPKRNAQRKAFQQVYDQFRRENKKLETVINERNINDTTFEEYPSIADLFYVVYEDNCKDGGNQKEKMQQTVVEFNKVIGKIFENYQLTAHWNDSTGTPSIELLKHGITRVPLEGLSLGEQEVLSLATNIYSSKNRYDVFIIDEPEVHLNWHLEEKLFEFFDDYCQEFKKQMIIVTHSRVVFKERYHSKTQFLYWTDQGKVSWSKDVTDEQRRRIAGDAIEIIKMGSFSKPTFFVEDSAQAEAVQSIANSFSVDIIITECGNSSNVRSIYKYSLIDSDWKNSFFIEDGDNQGSPFPNSSNFIHLKKYCIENYFLDFNVASDITNRTPENIKELIVESILENKSNIFKKNKFFEFLVDQLKPEHITEDNLSKLDASQIMKSFLTKINMSYSEYIDQYVSKCTQSNELLLKLPTAIVEIFNKVKEDNETA